MRYLPEQAVHCVDGTLFAHARLQLLVIDAIVDHCPRDEVEHPTTRLDEHQSDHIDRHARGIAGDGDAHQDDGRNDAQKEGHPDRNLFAEPRHDLGRERQEEHHGRIGYDRAKGDHVRVLEVYLEQPLGRLGAGHEEHYRGKRSQTQREQRSVGQKAFQGLQIIDLLAPFRRNYDALRRHLYAQGIGDERDRAHPERHPHQDVAHQVLLFVVKQEGEQHTDRAADGCADGTPRRKRSPLDGVGGYRRRKRAVRHVH